MRLQPVPLAVAGLAAAAFLVYVLQALQGPPGLAAAKEADRLLADGKAQAALAAYDAALQADPDLLPARLGRALALAAAGEDGEAERALDALVLALRPAAADDRRRSFLAAALANRGILRDRGGRHAEALLDYQAALRTAPAAVAGPGVIDRMLYGGGASSLAERAAYLERQLALPPEQRLLALPPADRQQRPTTR
jgi:tetratricopeptide (TPR) repeat protein